MTQEKIQRNPIPRNNVERFVGLVINMADLCCIDKVPELYHHVELLVRAADQHLFEKEKGGQVPKVAEEKRKFIAIFKNRFRVSLDYDYPNAIGAVELRMIGQFLEKLEEKHVDADYYLKWLFEDFLVRKSNFNPPNIKFVCSNMAWGEFMFSNKDELKSFHEQYLKKEEGLDLINRARILIREVEDQEKKTRIAETLREYRDKRLSLPDLRKKIQEYEKEHRKE